MKKISLITGIMALIIHLIARGGLGIIVLGILIAAVLTPIVTEQKSHNWG